VNTLANREKPKGKINKMKVLKNLPPKRKDSTEGTVKRYGRKKRRARRVGRREIKVMT